MQNIVINQIPISHAIMTNSNNGIQGANSLSHSNNTESGSGLSHAHLGSVQNPGPNQKPQQNQSNSEPALVLTKQRLQDLVRETDQTLSLEEEVEEIILGYVDEFVDRCLNGAALIAKNRHVNSIEVKDVQQFLNRNYNMWTPGFGTDELKPYKRSLTTEAHKQRIALIRKTLKKY